jgi:uncharacterized protein
MDSSSWSCSPLTPAWLDNLVPLKVPRLGAEQLAGWQLTTGHDLGCRLLADRRIPIDSGIALSADVYVPRPPGRYPAIVQFAAYSRELHTTGAPKGSNGIGGPPVFTDRGYAQIVVTRRGMGRSRGEAEVFFNTQDVDDHERCIAWAAAQPWCDGNIGLFGTCYYGLTQPLVVVRPLPALKAFFRNEICADYFRQFVRFGGTFGLFSPHPWMGVNFTRTMYRIRVPRAASRAGADQPSDRFNVAAIAPTARDEADGRDLPELHEQDSGPAGARVARELDDRRKDP